MEFQAKIAGAEIKKDETSLIDRIKQRQQQEREKQEPDKKNSNEFSQGVGYRVIGG